MTLTWPAAARCPSFLPTARLSPPTLAGRVHWVHPGRCSDGGAESGVLQGSPLLSKQPWGATSSSPAPPLGSSEARGRWSPGHPSEVLHLQRRKWRISEMDHGPEVPSPEPPSSHLFPLLPRSWLLCHCCHSHTSKQPSLPDFLASQPQGSRPHPPPQYPVTSSFQPRFPRLPRLATLLREGRKSHQPVWIWALPSVRS